jgi:hypothetical protein
MWTHAACLHNSVHGLRNFGGGAEFSPGDRIKDIGVRPVPGASELAPGDRMNDTRKR